MFSRYQLYQHFLPLLYQSNLRLSGGADAHKKTKPSSLKSVVAKTGQSEPSLFSSSLILHLSPMCFLSTLAHLLLPCLVLVPFPLSLGSTLSASAQSSAPRQRWAFHYLSANSFRNQAGTGVIAARCHLNANEQEQALSRNQPQNIPEYICRVTQITFHQCSRFAPCWCINRITWMLFSINNNSNLDFQIKL